MNSGAVQRGAWYATSARAQAGAKPGLRVDRHHAQRSTKHRSVRAETLNQSNSAPRADEMSTVIAADISGMPILFR